MVLCLPNHAQQWAPTETAISELKLKPSSCSPSDVGINMTILQMNQQTTTSTNFILPVTYGIPLHAHSVPTVSNQTSGSIESMDGFYENEEFRDHVQPGKPTHGGAPWCPPVSGSYAHDQ